jgi:hypothetical protein
MLEVFSNCYLKLNPNRRTMDAKDYIPIQGPLLYPTFKTHSKNGDSYQGMTQAIG